MSKYRDNETMKRACGLLLMVATMLLAACTDEPTPQYYEDGEELMVANVTRGVAGMVEVNEDYSPIHLFIADVENGTYRAGTFDYRTATNKWQSNMTVKSGTQYYIYGFMPATITETSSIAVRTSMDYSAGCVMTLQNLPTVSDKDVCAVIAVQHADTEDTPENLYVGQFGYLAGEPGHNYLYLLMDHLYAAMNIKFRINSTYDELRDIKVKKVELKCSNYTKHNVGITITTGSSTPLTISSLAGTAGEVKQTLFNGDRLLTSNYNDLEITGYALSPTANYSIVSTYDVYDSKGNLIRENETAENQISFGTLTRGNKYPVNITVNPTYLYMLSEPDLDSPTFEITTNG